MECISGEIEWTRNGRYTGETELELTLAGTSQVTSTRSHLISPGKLVDQARIPHTFFVPRAQHTLRLLFDSLDVAEKLTLTVHIARRDYDS